jgi:hypothetical protein
MGEKQFGDTLAAELYRKLKTAAGSAWADLARCLTAETIAFVNRDGWKAFLEFFHTHADF